MTSESLPFRTTHSFWLVRAALLRSLGLIYAVAFAILVQQGPALLGEQGILPAAGFVEAVSKNLGSKSAGFWELPSLFWLSASDAWLQAGAWAGLLGALAMVAGFSSAPLLLTLWALYLSFTKIGQIFYGYGWDMLLCEAGFLASFLAPAWRPRELDARSPPPLVVIVLFRWLTFRLMFGAGMIKLRGDPCWTDLTCLAYHYETQPNPGPLSPLFHAAPLWFHKLGTAFNHFVEALVPFGLFGPRPVRAIAGTLVIVFQAILILSGNLSFLNWLTLFLALACFDDQQLLRVVPRRFRETLRARVAAVADAKLSRARHVATVALALVVAVLSFNPVWNLLSPRQAMNASFEPFGLVNTYGAFGSVSRERYEVVIEGTADGVLSEHSKWLEYQLPCKPGDVYRRPCWVTPYHYRLDWQLWFVPLSPDRQWPWFLSLTRKLLNGDARTLALFAQNPFPDRPPRYIRASYFRYTLAPLGARPVWHRQRVGQYLPPTSLDDPSLDRTLRAYGL